MHFTSAIWTVCLAIWITSGFQENNVSGALSQNAIRRKVRSNQEASSPNNQMYINSRAASRYQSVDFDTAESIRSNNYDTSQDEPYRFSYMVDDQSSNMQFRSEQRMPDGQVRGSYGFRDAHTGVYRLVEYVADETGFHAKIHSNEPGVRMPATNGAAGATRTQLPAKLRDRHPANVQWSFDREPDMSEWYGRRLAHPYQSPSQNSYQYSANEPKDQYRAAASHLQPSGAQSSHASDINRKSSDAIINSFQSKPILIAPPSVTIADEPNTFSPSIRNQAQRKRNTVLKRVLRPASSGRQPTDGTASFDFGKLQTRPVLESESSLEVKPVFQVNSDSKGVDAKERIAVRTVVLNANPEASRHIPDASITKSTTVISESSRLTPNSVSSLEKSPDLDLHEFSQKFPDKWQRILISNQPELNVFGEKIGWSGDRLHRLESENGLFANKLHRLVNEQQPLASSLTGRSVDSAIKRTLRTPVSVKKERQQRKSSDSEYIPPLTTGSTEKMNNNREPLMTSATRENSASTQPLKLTTVTMTPLEQMETITSVSISSSVSMQTSNLSNKAKNNIESSANVVSTEIPNISNTEIKLPKTTSTSIDSTLNMTPKSSLLPTTVTTASSVSSMTSPTEMSTIAKVIKQ